MSGAVRPDTNVPQLRQICQKKDINNRGRFWKQSQVVREGYCSHVGSRFSRKASIPSRVSSRSMLVTITCPV